MTKDQELENIKQKILEKNLPLKDTSKNLVFGKGNPNAKIMFIGEAPGEKEDEKGVPFVGSAGKELDRLLSLIELKIDDVYIANILKYRPPNNRNPSIDEIEMHTPYLIEQIKVIEPKIIIPMHYDGSDPKQIASQLDGASKKNKELGSFLKEFSEENIEKLDKLTIKKKDINEEKMRVVALESNL